MRNLWDLEAGGAFLNHGSFGACPRAVLEAQARIRARMESQPDVFFRREVFPADEPTPLREAAEALATYVGAPGRIAFVENATVGVQCVLRSLPLVPGDEVLVTDHTYNAVRLMVEARCAETGAGVRTAKIPLPATGEGIVQAIEAALTPAVRLAIVDHITSPTALVLPLGRLLPILRRHGARVAVDGAHAVGQVALDLAALGADWYVSNCHKWLFAPRGTAFLYAAPEAAGMTRPPVASHFVHLGFPRSFDWIGTRDYSAWLAVPAAIRFHSGLGPAALRERQVALLRTATQILGALGIAPVAPMELCAAMRSFELPLARPAAQADAVWLMRELWDHDRVQAMAVAFGERLLLRVSAQAYVEEEDLRRLAAALARAIPHLR